jgi:hypothetical protein
MENNLRQQSNLDQSEASRAALVERHREFLEKAALQGINPDSLIPLLGLADLAISKLGKILKGKRIC